MSQPIVFVICTEAGSLEQESLLLVESIRKFAGGLKDTPIYSFQVREGYEISSPTLNSFKSFNVIHQKLVLNSKYPNYPLANKPLLAAYVEQNIDTEIIVFLDSDIVLFSEPKEFLLPPEYEIGLRPEHHKKIGSEGKGDSNEAYWQKIYKLAGVKEELFVTTTVDRKKIRAYWNSGVIAVRRKAGIFTAWKHNFEKLAETEDVSSINKANFYFEQSMFSATVSAMTKKIWNFSPGYNYPIHYHNTLPESEQRSSFGNTICIHDHFFRERKEWFRERIWVKNLKTLRNFDKKSPYYRWFYNYLTEKTSQPNILQIIVEKMFDFY